MRFPPSFLDDIRARLPISQVIGARVSWDRKKTNASRGDYWAPCPFHGEKSPSFHCEDGKGRYHCFGCSVSGDHFKFLTELDGMTFPRAVEELASMAGIPMPNASPPTAAELEERRRRAVMRDAEAARAAKERAKDDARRVKGAGAIWKETVPLLGTLGAVYFEHRGLPVSTDENIRYHPGLEHPATAGTAHPVVIARVQAPAGQGTGIWRIFLAQDGRGKLAGVDAKLGLGPTAGGAVRLGGMAKRIGIAEGVETSLAVRELGETRPVWAGLSTSGISGFVIPDGVEHVLIYPDPDGSKIKTRFKLDGTPYIGKSPGYEAARKLCERYPDKTSIAPAAFDADYLEVLQKMKGVPIR